MRCSICFELNPNEDLRCGHTFHLTCINRWKEINDSCPMCRENIRLTDIRNLFLELSDEEFSSFTCDNKQFRTTIVPKNTNPQVNESEQKFIKKFSGKNIITQINKNLINRNIIAYIPKTSGNNIYLGKAIIEDDKIIFNNSYVMCRTSGHVYKTKPLLRSYKLNDEDIFYKIT